MLIKNSIYNDKGHIFESPSIYTTITSDTDDTSHLVYFEKEGETCFFFFFVVKSLFCGFWNIMM